MDITYYAVSLLIGWCGTRWPGWPLGPRPPIPDPEPWWRVIGIGALGGIAGGILINVALPNEISLVTVSIGAFVGGRISSDLYSIARRGIALPQDPIPVRRDS